MAEDDVGWWSGEAEDELALLIGRVCMAWNEMQYTVFGLFELVTDFEHYAAQAGFFSIKVDTAQRDMTQAMFAAAFANRPDWVKRLDRILADIGSLSGERNAAIHTAWSFWVTEQRMGPAGGWVPHKRLSDDPAKQFGDLTDRISDQQTLLQDLVDEVANWRHFESPARRPPLLREPHSTREGGDPQT